MSHKSKSKFVSKFASLSVPVSNNLTINKLDKNIDIKRALLEKINILNFSSDIEERFFSHIKRDWERFGIIKYVIYKQHLHYPPLSHLSNLQFGRIFKQSKNGIIDFIKSGIYFHPSDSAAELRGLLILNVMNNTYFCYYSFDTGACPTCGMWEENDESPTQTDFYIADNWEDLFHYCMTDN